MRNSSYIDYSKLHKEDTKLNDKLIISYHKKYKIKYLIVTEIIGLISLYTFAYFSLGSNFSVEESINIFPTFVILLLILFFMFYMIKWS